MVVVVGVGVVDVFVVLEVVVMDDIVVVVVVVVVSVSLLQNLPDLALSLIQSVTGGTKVKMFGSLEPDYRNWRDLLNLRTFYLQRRSYSPCCRTGLQLVDRISPESCK